MDEIVGAARGQQPGSRGEAFDRPLVCRVRRLALQAGAVLHTPTRAGLSLSAMMSANGRRAFRARSAANTEGSRRLTSDMVTPKPNKKRS